MSNWPANKLARTALLLLRKSGGRDDIYLVMWEYIFRVTDGKFKRLADYVTAPAEMLPTGHSDERRDEILRTIISALESGDIALLEKP